LENAMSEDNAFVTGLKKAGNLIVVVVASILYVLWNLFEAAL